MSTSNTAVAEPTAEHSLPLSELAIQELTQLLNTAITCYQETRSEKLSIEEVKARQKQCLELTDKVLTSDPFNVEALNVIARVELDQNNIDKADNFCSTALAIEPDSATTWYTLGQIALAKSKLKDAEHAFIKCIRLDSTFFRAHTSYAFTKLAQGDIAAAFVHYQRLARVRPDDFHIKSKLFECLRQLKADYDNDNLAKDLVSYFLWTDVNYQDLGNITSSLLVHRYKLDTADSQVDLAKLSKDPLYNVALRKLYFCDPKIEELNGDLRSYFLNVDSNLIGQDETHLMISLAKQSHNNEYVLYETQHERNELDRLYNQLQSSNIDDLNTFQPEILKLLMFMPLSNVLGESQLEQLLSRKDKLWNSEFLELIQTLKAEEDYRHDDEIKSMAPITNKVSCAVREQYEKNPYPRWLTVDYHTPTTYGEALEKAIPGYKAPTRFHNERLEILIAGCGTGRHAIQVARYFRDVKVTAIDMSLHSLSYALDMARAYELTNIEFIQADILNLKELDKSFDIIECSGVLHHMEDPSAGAEVLKSLLKDDGLMKIGLYSERARSEVIGCRKIISETYDVIDSQAIRSFRKEILKHGKDFPQIMQSIDFYSLSGCRDLLFHVQEHRFTPALIQSMLSSLNMKFLGFVHVQPVYLQQFYAQFNGDNALTDLNNWEEFEKSNPLMFSGMYQFYVDKKSL